MRWVRRGSFTWQSERKYRIEYGGAAPMLPPYRVTDPKGNSIGYSSTLKGAKNMAEAQLKRTEVP